MKWAEWMEIPAIQRRKTIRFNWIRFAVDIRVMQAHLKQTISAPAGASYGATSPVGYFSSQERPNSGPWSCAGGPKGWG